MHFLNIQTIVFPFKKFLILFTVYDTLYRIPDNSKFNKCKILKILKNLISNFLFIKNEIKVERV